MNFSAFGVIALAICYDIRFPHLLSAMLQQNKDICCYLLPSAFNTTTGPYAWEILQRVRALDNQIFVGMCSPARNDADQVRLLQLLRTNRSNISVCLIRTFAVMRTQRTDHLDAHTAGRRRVYRIRNFGS